MVTVSHELPAQTESRLRAVFRGCRIDWLPGSWAFQEGQGAGRRDDAIAEVRDEGRVSALCPAGVSAAERFVVFRVVLPRGADDSGFVGWLASRVKAATGSGLIVVCGHSQQWGGIFDYYGVPEASAEAVRTLLRGIAATGSLDGAVMRVIETAPHARIGPDTVFCLDLNNSRLSGRYGGGPVADGWLAGDLDPTGTHARFRYLQVGTDGVIDSGESTADVARLPDGRFRLTEHFTWSSRAGSGTNQLEE